MVIRKWKLFSVKKYQRIFDLPLFISMDRWYCLKYPSTKHYVDTRKLGPSTDRNKMTLGDGWGLNFSFWKFLEWVLNLVEVDEAVHAYLSAQNALFCV